MFFENLLILLLVFLLITSISSYFYSFEYDIKDVRYCPSNFLEFKCQTHKRSACVLSELNLVEVFCTISFSFTSEDPDTYPLILWIIIGKLPECEYLIFSNIDSRDR